jgi:pilus assembly protein Flp/PilA
MGTSLASAASTAVTPGSGRRLQAVAKAPVRGNLRTYVSHLDVDSGPGRTAPDSAPIGRCPARPPLATLRGGSEFLFPGHLCHVKGTEIIFSSVVKVQVRIAALRSDRGATAVEYALMVTLIALVVVLAVTLLGTNVKNIFTKVATSV